MHFAWSTFQDHVCECPYTQEKLSYTNPQSEWVINRGLSVKCISGLQWAEEPGELHFMGVAKSWTGLSNWAHTHEKSRSEAMINFRDIILFVTL